MRRCNAVLVPGIGRTHYSGVLIPQVTHAMTLAMVPNAVHVAELWLARAACNAGRLERVATATIPLRQRMAVAVPP